MRRKNDSDSLVDVRVSRRTMLKGTAAAAAVAGVVLIPKGRGNLQALQASSPQTTEATDPFAAQQITLNVNGKDVQVQVEPRSMLVDVLRDTMGLIAIKRVCNRMSCGACTVLIDGKAVESCGYLALRAVGHNIVTPEITQNDPVVNALQQAAPIADMAQCGYCIPGIIMGATALLKVNPNPTVTDVKNALGGHICYCGNYLHIIDGVMLAAKNLSGGS